MDDHRMAFRREPYHRLRDADEARMMDRKLARTAHDVRHLCVCEGCKELADDRDTVNPGYTQPFYRDTSWHPKCYYEKFGRPAVIERLSRENQNKFRLCDIPSELMRELLEERE